MYSNSLVLIANDINLIDSILYVNIIPCDRRPQEQPFLLFHGVFGNRLAKFKVAFTFRGYPGYTPVHALLCKPTDPECLNTECLNRFSTFPRIYI